MSTGIRAAGDFCWINVLTPQPEKSRAFFGKLLKWTFVELPSLGHRIQVRGRHIGGIFDSMSPRFPRGAPPSIEVMIKVDNADDAVTRAKELGGLVRAPTDVGAGRMAECFDPNGAHFDVWEPISMAGYDVDSSLHGAPSWFEIISHDTERDRAFYTALFGWTSTEIRLPHAKYTTFYNGNAAPIAGMLPWRTELTKYKPHWGVYFTVDNVDQSTSFAELLGATTFIQPQDIPGAGRFAYLRSPDGVYFYIISYRAA